MVDKPLLRFEAGIREAGSLRCCGRNFICMQDEVPAEAEKDEQDQD